MRRVCGEEEGEERRMDRVVPRNVVVLLREKQLASASVLNSHITHRSAGDLTKYTNSKFMKKHVGSSGAHRDDLLRKIGEK